VAISKRIKRKWHPVFQKYMEEIIRHNTYANMPSIYKADGKIQWVVTGKSKIGQLREEWWNNKRQELGITKKPGWKAKVARQIHPTGYKPCQVCGKILKLDYIYPNLGCYYKKNRLEECNDTNCDKSNSKCKGPGAMSDCPDRFDGFHTYNRCCRSTEDTGRHKENLNRYGEDRRVYEFWSDGDWKKSDWLMQEFRKHSISPDHIGPISLGFCHRPKFEPMTIAQNTAKGNRLSLKDIQVLINDEKSGAVVVSRHSKHIWDLLKGSAKNDSDAKLISSLMRLNLHKVLNVFAAISKKGYNDFLVKTFLHPEYALFQHKFENFNPSTGEVKIITKRANRTENKRNADRYIRKSFEFLKKYITKDNRKVKHTMSIRETVLLNSTFQALSTSNYKKANLQINGIFLLWAFEAVRDFAARKGLN